MKFDGEIQYQNSRNRVPVHGFIRFNIGKSAEDSNEELDDEYRHLIHKLLDEWFDESESDGFFWVGNKEQLIESLTADKKFWER